MFEGQVIVGGWLSLTVTVNLQTVELLEVSVAVQVTVVTPFGNVEPEAGLHTTPTPGQLSFAVAVKLAVVEHWPGSAFFTILAGQVTEGC
jgi:hypothetical protein